MISSYGVIFLCIFQDALITVLFGESVERRELFQERGEGWVGIHEWSDSIAMMMVFNMKR